MKLLRTFAVLLIALVASVSALGDTGQSDRTESTLELNGVTFIVPIGLVRVAEPSASESIFLLNKGAIGGTFVSVAVDSVAVDELVRRSMKRAIEVYFPKESPNYLWRRMSALPKVSRFEISNGQAEAFNKANLIGFQYRRVAFQGRNVVVGEMYEIASGKEADERIKAGTKTISISGCNIAARIIYSITGEKYEESNPPCQLIAAPQD